MNPDDKFSLYKTAFRKWGSQTQAQVAVEECAELAAAISRFITGKGSFEQVCEEMADVEIMMEQLQYHYEAVHDVHHYKMKKLERLANRLSTTTAALQTELNLENPKR